VSLAEAIRERDVSRLPSRRDEDWRWTDLRGLIRQAPEPSAPLAADRVGEGPFSSLAGRTLVVANGRGPASLQIEGEAVIAVDFVSGGVVSQNAAEKRCQTFLRHGVDVEHLSARNDLHINGKTVDINHPRKQGVRINPWIE